MMEKERIREIKRKTNETDISLKFNLDGKGNSEIKTGIGFFDHMLTLFSKHGIFDLYVQASGDLDVDCHHMVEDIGISLGKCIAEALADKRGIKRYGTAFVPMDEALAMVSLDLSGRAFLVFDCEMGANLVGNFDTETVEEFFRALAVNAGLTLHIKLLYGKNTHHIIEAVFKAFGRALREAASFDERIEGLMSTKGVL